MAPQDTQTFDALLEKTVDHQVRRVLKAGAAVRVAGTLVFLLIVGALWLMGRQDWAPYPSILSISLSV
jgi:hypothetical protein